MRSLILVLVALLLCPTRATAQGAADSVAVRRLDSLWARVYATHDTIAASRLYAEDLVFTSTNGARKTKQQELDDVRAQPGLVMEYFRSAPSTVRVYAGAAVVTGVAQWRFTLAGTPREVRRAYTMVYVRGGDFGWRVVAVHMGNAPSS